MRPIDPLRFGPSHPLAEVAERQCDAPTGHLIGGIACAACWERAIRDDERVVVEHGLSREMEPDPTFVDYIAVELACRGERVQLTAVEFHTAVWRLAGRRLTAVDIARRLHTRYSKVAAALSEPSETGASMPHRGAA
jgi:hypothetical protein